MCCECMKEGKERYQAGKRGYQLKERRRGNCEDKGEKKSRNGIDNNAESELRHYAYFVRDRL